MHTKNYELLSTECEIQRFFLSFSKYQENEASHLFRRHTKLYYYLPGVLVFLGLENLKYCQQYFKMLISIAI